MIVTNIGEKNIGDIINKCVYIYGAGEYAHDVSKVLEKYGITINGYIVDDDYFVSKENNIKYSDFKENQDVVVVNGIANVATFKNIIGSKKFNNLYTTFGLTRVWSYDDDYFKNKKKEIESVLNMFCDEESRQTYKNYLYCIQHDEIVPIIETANASDIYFNSLSCSMYDGAFVDCGAFNGDTIKKFKIFIEKTEKKKFEGEIFAFEPDNKNYKEMVGTFVDDKTIHCINKGVWDKQGFMQFSKDNGMGSCFIENSDSCDAVEVTDIDSAVGNARISFIKMDVEGAEYKALVGAHKVIGRDYPILAISAYHKMEDLVELPQLIKKFENHENGYKLYLRHHGVCPMELVIYGIPYKKQR